MKELRKLSKWYKSKMLGYKKPIGVPALIHPENDNVFELKNVNGKWLHPVPLQAGEYIGVTIAGKNYHLHRLKAETFLPKPDEYKGKLIVNHKDGDKTNNMVSNYEWTDYSGNILHAYQNGLRSDNFSGKAYDIIDGCVYEFYSYANLSSQLGINAGYISYYMKKKRDYPFRRRYVVVLTGCDYPDITKDDIWKAGVGSEMPIRVLDTIENKTMIFSSFTSMKKTLKLNYGQRERFVAGKTYSFGKGRHIVTVLTEYDEIMEAFKTDPNYIDRDYKHLDYVTPRNKVEVKFPDGSIKVFSDVNQAAIYLGSTYAALTKRIHSFNGEWKGHVLKYF